MLKPIYKSIPSSFRYLNWVFTLGLSVFLFYRILFYLIYKPEVSSDFSIIVKSFFFGLRFDNALFSYVFFMPLLLFFINELNNNKLKLLKLVSVLYIAIIFLLYQFVYAADIPYYKQFGNHLNKNALLWKDNASFVLGFIFENFSYWGFSLVFILTAVVSIYFLLKFNAKLNQEMAQSARPKTMNLVFWFVIYASALVLGARGTISEKTVMHEGFAIISSNSFINNVCLNPNYCFFKSIIDYETNSKYHIPENINESFNFTRHYLNIPEPNARNIDRIDSSENKKINYV